MDNYSTPAYFLSCDWGTSSLRLRLARLTDGEILLEERSRHGIAETFDLWRESGAQTDEQKIAFYLNVVRNHIERLEISAGLSLDGAKVIISGMASSSIGLVEIPYAHVPVALDGSDFQTAAIPATGNFNHDVLIISGVRTGEDVMRGEETQLTGCIGEERQTGNALYIFPGTHSKHITVVNDQITSIKTYMTGEFFYLLSQKSILKNDVIIPVDEAIVDLDIFKQGAMEALSGNLLNSAFSVRTNQLLGRFTKRENFNYLSGLLVGNELKDLRYSGAGAIHLLCSPNLSACYQAVLEELYLSASVNSYSPKWVDEAAVRGQLQIGRQLNFLK